MVGILEVQHGWKDSGKKLLGYSIMSCYISLLIARVSDPERESEVGEIWSLIEPLWSYIA